VIGYACAWLKHHYPLEWWTAVLRHAEKKELDEKFWRHCGHLIEMPDISLSSDTFDIVGDRIRAPLNLLQGMGPKAMEEVVKYRPVASIEEFCQKIEARRVAEGSTIVKELKTIDKATGLPKKKTVIKKARTTLGYGVTDTLIISGAMDSLFPPDMELYAKLQMYIDIKSKVTGEVYKVGDRAGMPKEKVKSKYLDLTALEQFQYRKKVLPSYTTNLLRVISNHSDYDLYNINGMWRYMDNGSSLTIATPEMLHQISNFSPWPPGQTLGCAVVAYVLKYERKVFHGSKQMASVILDIEGSRWELVKWPGRDNKLPAYLNRDLTGAVVIAVLSKYKEEKPFVIDDIRVLQEPLSEEKAEETPETGDDE
jgi:DNA polymerase III alpha subunit